MGKLPVVHQISLRQDVSPPVDPCLIAQLFLKPIRDCSESPLNMGKMSLQHDCTVVLVGDHRVGKTALVTKYKTGRFESGYNRTNTEKIMATTAVDGVKVEFTICDLSGSRCSSIARDRQCRDADVFLLCFKISDPSTLFGAVNFWVPELRRYAPATPIVLVGLQTDLRSDRATLQSLAKQGRSPVSSEQARSFSQQADAVGYVETSSRVSSQGPASVFELAAKISLEQMNQNPNTSVASGPAPSVISSASGAMLSATAGAASISASSAASVCSGASFSFVKPKATSTPENTIDREYSTESTESFWEQYNASPALPRQSLYSRSGSLSSSVSSSLNSTRSSTLSIPRSPVRNRRNSMSLRAGKGASAADRMIKIKCQRLTVDKIYEEVEIEVPAPIYETLQACNETAPADSKKKESLGAKLKNLFIRD